MEIADVVKVKESSTTNYKAENGNLKYSIAKQVEENALKSIVCSVNKEISNEDGTKDDQYLGIAQLSANQDGTRSLIYSLKEDCTDKVQIIADFDITVTAVK